ncbi:uncharacterized protein Obp18a [Drosophila takahashii]|uniref:uncharacterized protein Obp18a n=1 Tax=Drosophila takahashii TaxID=29030 RepID=UPI0007E689A0|nr:uncharacterized protein LOC108058168 [Drosophila takahashii]
MKVAQSFVLLWICLIATCELPGCLAQDSCMTKNNVTSAELEAISPSTPISDVSLAVKCYSRCVLDEYIGDDGRIDLEKVGSRGNKQEHIILAQCKQRYDDVTDRLGCDYSFLMLRCLFKSPTSETRPINLI